MTDRRHHRLPHSHWVFVRVVQTAVTFLAVCPAAWGLNIMLHKAPAGTTLTPVYDPNLNQLQDAMEAAALYWESIILDNHTVDVTFGYVDLAPAVHGLAVVNDHDGLRATDGSVAFDIENNMVGDWYFDPTPHNHSEFSMHQVLYRDLAGPARNLFYDNVAPEVLEVGYWGNYVGADQGRDALTTAVHELGHILGLSAALPDFNTEVGDGEYNFNIFYTQGLATAVNYHSPDPQERDHVRSSDSTMAVGAGHGDRNLPGATDVFAAATVSNWLLIDLPRKDFWGNGATNWNNNLNWPGNRLPDAEDEVYVRNGATPTLTIANGAAGNLFIQEEAVVSTGNETLNVTDKVTIEGGNPGAQANLVVNSGGRVTANEIELNEGGLLTLTSGVTEEVEADVVDINPGGVLLGNGDVRVNSILRNDGTISAFAGAGDELSLLSGPVDLDGVNGDGEVFAVLGNLRVSADISDPFDGRMTIGSGHQVQIFGSSWQVGQVANSDAEIILQGGSITNPARLIKTLSSITFNSGSLEVSGAGEIVGRTIFEDGFTMNVNSGATLILGSETTYRGGTHQGNGVLRFGDVVIVEADTTLGSSTVDLDSTSGATAIQLDFSALTLNVNSVDLDNNRFDGSLQLTGQGASLIVNLSSPADSWQMDGTLTASVAGILPQTTLAGNPVSVTGDMTITGSSIISAPMDLSGSLTTGNILTTVTLQNGPHIIRNGSTTSGGGRLRVFPGGQLLVEDDAVIGIEVSNDGRFEPGTSIGLATINEDFTQTASGTLAMELSGAPGTNQDVLDVNGSASINGALEVTVLEGAMPSIGPIYTLLTADSVSGTFDLTLLSETIFQYEGTLSYPGTRVTLQFTDVSMFGDFVEDMTLDCADVDALVAEIASGDMNAIFDLNDDTLVDMADLELWLQEAGEFNVGGPYLPGDANLDGTVDGADYQEWIANKFTSTAAWCSADFNADGVTDGRDLLIWNQFKFMSSDMAQMVPEPVAGWLLLLCGVWAFGRRK